MSVKSIPEENASHMLGDLENKKYPSITIQGVLLAASVLYLKHESPSLLVMLSIATVLSLFVLQAFNHRFYYHFPVNRFTGTATPDFDTYLLYALTFFAIMFLIWGIAGSFLLAMVLSIFIFAPGICWRIFMYKRVRERITCKLQKEDIVYTTQCPQCGAKARLTRKVLRWNEGYEKIECLEGCRAISEKQVPLNIG